jgi:hypothetical protein
VYWSKKIQRAEEEVDIDNGGESPSYMVGFGPG